MTTNQKALTVAPVKQEEYITIDTIKCHSCGADVEIQENKNHSEYAPGGRCKNCGILHLMTNHKEIITMDTVA